MGKKTRAAQQAHRASNPRLPEGVPLPNGKTALTLGVLRFGSLLEELTAYCNDRLVDLPETTLMAAAGWLKHAIEARPDKRPKCMTCSFEFAGGATPLTAVSHLVFLEGIDEGAVSFLCAACCAGKSGAEITGIVGGYYHNLAIGPFVSARQH